VSLLIVANVTQLKKRVTSFTHFKKCCIFCLELFTAIFPADKNCPK